MVGPGDGLKELVQVFEDATNDRVTDLKAAYEARDLKVIERTAHTIKGSGATFGANELGEAARRLEHLARSTERVEDTAAGIEEIEQTVAETRVAIGEVLRQLGIE